MLIKWAVLEGDQPICFEQTSLAPNFLVPYFCIKY
jgi:hypothetical protein